MYVDHHPIAIDIGYFKVHGFLEAKSAGVDRGQEGIIVECVDAIEDTADFFYAEYSG